VFGASPWSDSSIDKVCTRGNRSASSECQYKRTVCGCDIAGSLSFRNGSRNHFHASRSLRAGRPRSQQSLERQGATTFLTHQMRRGPRGRS
jgi:hypothetical protein